LPVPAQGGAQFQVRALSVSTAASMEQVQ
jgi:hypothetical protein